MQVAQAERRIAVAALRCLDELCLAPHLLGRHRGRPQRCFFFHASRLSPAGLTT
jgi:hypothetical protein